jgi:hypothetical protein
MLADHMSGPIVKAANEVNVEREIGLKFIRRIEAGFPFVSTIGYFVSVFEMLGAGKCLVKGTKG